MHVPVLLLITTVLAQQAPLVAPPAPEKQPQPRKEQGSNPPAAPSQPGAEAPPQAIPSTGIPLVDQLLRKIPGLNVPPEQVDAPPLQPGQPRPLIGVQFDLEDFLNASYFREETLLTFVRHGRGVPTDKEQLNADASSIAFQYRERGFLQASVRWSIEELSNGDVVTFHITAGPRATLKAIELVGNRALKEDQLLVNLFHRPRNLFSLTDRAGVYHAGYLQQDMQAIAKNYADHGYLAANVTDARAYGNTDGTEVTLRFDVEDGPLFHVGSFVLAGDLPLKADASMRVLGFKPGSPAALKKLEEATERLLDLWRNVGYARAKATRSDRIHATEPLVDFVIRVDKGPVTRVGKIKIVGDPSTADHVIKRDVVVREGQVYSLRALKLSEERLMYTGLFQKVELRPAFTDDPETVDVEIEVTEQQSWYLSLAPSWFPGEGLIGIGMLGFSNAFGQAWRIHAQGVLSQFRQTGRVYFEDPRVLDTPLSVSVGGNRDRFVYPAYGLIRTGGQVGMGYPLIDRLRLQLGYGLERVDMEDLGPVARYMGTARFPTGKRRGVIRLDAILDHRDNALFPTRGFYLEANTEYGGPIALGELNFITLKGNARFYLPLPRGFVLKNNLAGAYVFNPTGGVVPATERFYEGGPIQTVRGYNFQTISPTMKLGDPLDPGGETMEVRLGGVSRLLNNLELESPPIPLSTLVPIKVFAFFDAGNTWSEQERPFFFPNVLLAQRDNIELPLGLFYSVGVGGMVASPLFPLRLEFTVPLTRRPQDEPLNFFVSAGSPF